MKTVLYILVSLALVGVVIADFAIAQENIVGEQPILLQGQVTDTDGHPLQHATVEIWQNDANGNYNHPDHTDPDLLLEDFQYFATATTDAEGYYAFMTAIPGDYEPIPVHIHFKVKYDQVERLTSEFSVDEAGGIDDPTLRLHMQEITDTDNQPLVIATGNIVLDMNGDDADTLPPTTALPEGPYYPVVDFSSYDNNLLSPTPDDPIIKPVRY